MIDIYCCINSASIWGIEPYIVKIEADISSGMPYFNMVGLLSSEVREARERVRTALKNSGEDIPLGRITVNLSPADRRKEGTGFDLPIAVSLLCAMGRLPASEFEHTLVIGELGLDGEIKGVRGILPIVHRAGKNGITQCIVPKENEKEGSVFSDIRVCSFQSLRDLIKYFDDNSQNRCDDYSSVSMIQRGAESEQPNVSGYRADDLREGASQNNNRHGEDFSQIIGQEAAKRALMIAVAGWHNILMIGPPGVGKSMLASRIPTIMPPLTMEERIEVSGIHSICGLLPENGLIDVRPFSSPHHTVTAAALIGGGRVPRPGEITIAHKGILFLDELPEFQPSVLESLRQPLEEKAVKIHRMGGSYIFPADCLLAAAMNPCKCGYYPDRSKCNCSEHDISAYLSRISGPLLDRIDMSVEVSAVDKKEFDVTGVGKYNDKILTSKKMRELICRAAAFQRERQGEKLNGSLSVDDIRKYCVLDRESADFMKEAYERFELSMRGYYKIIKTARTIADLEGSEKIMINHLAESLAYRVSDIKHLNNKKRSNEWI